jgi:hypothetical protein
MTERGIFLFSQNLHHLFSFRELIHELIEVADLPHESVFHPFDPVSTDGASDEFSIWVQLRLTEKGLEVDLSLEDSSESRRIVSCEPGDDLIEFSFGASLSLHFRDIEWVDGGEGHFENTGVLHEIRVFCMDGYR